MWLRKHRLPLILLVILLIEKCRASSFKFLNLKCEEFDKTFVEFRTCRLKLIRRGVSALSVHVNLYKVPVENITLNLSLWQKANGYHPFLYNYTVDFCDYSKFPARYPFIRVILTAIQKYSNLNHTCPYNHDIIVDKMVLNENMLRLMPVPTGLYMFQLNFAAYNEWKVSVKVFTERYED